MRLTWALALAVALLRDPCPSFAGGEPQVFDGEEWVLADKFERLHFIDGYRRGLSEALSSLSDACQQEAGRLDFGIPFSNGAIEEVMTSLYQDPANRHIEWSRLLFVARDKLRGDDMEASLRSARAVATRRIEREQQQPRE